MDVRFMKFSQSDLDDEELAPKETEEFAIADGFENINDMLVWFHTDLGKNFKGVVIMWEQLIKL